MSLPLSVLAFFAHPDDETMLCGGTLAMLAEAGAQVHILISTRGEGGEMGDPPLCEREQLGQVREDELRCAARALGATQLLLLDYQDPLIGPENALFPFTEDMDRLVTQVQETIHQTGAQVLLSHGVNGEYGHPAHKLAHQAARRAAEQMGDQAPLFYTVMGDYPDNGYPRLMNVDAPAHLVLDIAPYMAHKIAAALCHRTQHALFVRHGSELAGRAVTVPEVVMSAESLSRVYPIFENGSVPSDALTALLLKSGLARGIQA
jgi:N-acetylglucosamine malate deacetylase 2